MRRTWAVAAGCTVVAAGWATVALVAINQTPEANSGHANEDPKPGGDDTRPRTLAFFVFGLVAMVTNFTSFVLFFPAVHAIAVSDASGSANTIALVILMALTLVTAYAPPLAATILGARAQAVLDRLGGFVTRHRATINATICFVFAVYLAVRGVDILT